MIETIATLARELLDDANTELANAAAQFGRPDFVGVVSGGHAPKQTAALAELIPEWKLAAQDAGLVKAISRLERAIQPWKTKGDAVSGPAYVSMFKEKRDEIEAVIAEIEGYGLSEA